jgi:uncharacterized protein (TIGR02145 family)
MGSIKITFDITCMKTKNRIWFYLLIIGLFLILAQSCKKDGESMPFTEGTVTDIEGNVYKTIQIEIPAGNSKSLETTETITQIWMAENLKTTKYSNGDLIGTTTPATLNIYDEAMAKYQWAYEGDESYVDTYGRIYTWWAVTDSRNVCPTGWHVPTDDEWLKLVLYLGGKNDGYGLYHVAGGKLKESGTTHWSSPNTGAVNSIGFTALPGGGRWDQASVFDYINKVGYWWTSTEVPERMNGYRRWGAYYSSQALSDEDSSANTGYSVRCLKD